MSKIPKFSKIVLFGFRKFVTIRPDCNPPIANHFRFNRSITVAALVEDTLVGGSFHPVNPVNMVLR